MTQFDEKTIRETAYYIWKNNGCPANSSTHDWNAAIEQLEQRDALSTAKQISSVYKAALSGFFMEKVQLLFATCRSSVMLAYLEGGCYGYFAERNFVGISSPLVWRAGI